MTKYGVFDAEGFPVAFYSEDIHGPRDGDTTIPPDAVVLSDQQWLEFISNQGLRRWVDGAILDFTPVVNPYLPLKPYQFWGAVRATGHDQSLKDWVAGITDPVQQGIASAMLEYSLEFRRDHPLIEAARLHLEMSESELNDLWLWGLTL